MKRSILFLGAFSPKGSRPENAATSTAANLFQEHLVSALKEADAGLSKIFCYLPMPSFPKHGTLVFLGGKGMTADAMPVTYLPFVNLGPLKTLTLGMAAFVSTLWWGLKQPRGVQKCVVVYNLNAPPARPILIACRMMRARFVPFLCDVYVPGEVVPDTWLYRAQYAAQKAIAGRLTTVIAANTSIIKDMAPTAEHVLVEGGVSFQFLDAFQGPATRRSTTTVLFAGGLTELNGLPLLLDAIRLIDDPYYEFLIAGKGPLERCVIERSVQDPRVKFLGQISHEQVVTHYQNADVLVSLRRTNNRTNRYVFPSKTIECIATGRPLVTTRTGQMESEFAEVVRLVEEETPESVAKTILETAAWSDNRRAAHFELSRQFIRNCRTWRSNMARIESLLDRTAA